MYADKRLVLGWSAEGSLLIGTCGRGGSVRVEGDNTRKSRKILNVGRSRQAREREWRSGEREHGCSLI